MVSAMNELYMLFRIFTSAGSEIECWSFLKHLSCKAGEDAIRTVAW